MVGRAGLKIQQRRVTFERSAKSQPSAQEPSDAWLLSMSLLRRATHRDNLRFEHAHDLVCGGTMPVIGKVLQ